MLGVAVILAVGLELVTGGAVGAAVATCFALHPAKVTKATPTAKRTDKRIILSKAGTPVVEMC
jgi:hypothetical protein